MTELLQRDLIGYCEIHRRELACYHARKLCSYVRSICQRRHQPCPCTYDPSKPVTPRISDKPLVDQRVRERLVFPNGYCRSTGGRSGRSMSCWFGSKKCTRGQDTCESAYDPCICDFHPDNQPASLKPAYPNGECRSVYGRGNTTPSTLRCTFRFRQCSEKHSICRMQYEHCTCDYNPFLSGSISLGPRARHGVDELPAPPQRKSNSEEKHYREYRPRVKFPPGQSLAQQRPTYGDGNQRRNYLQVVGGNALSIRSLLQPVCMVHLHSMMLTSLYLCTELTD